MPKKKRNTPSKNSVSGSTGLAADKANPPPASPTPRSPTPTPTPESSASTSVPVEPPPPPPAPNSGAAHTNGTDPVDLKARADASKEQGNVFFKSKEYEKAVGLYTEAISESGHSTWNFRQLGSTPLAREDGVRAAKSVTWSYGLSKPLGIPAHCSRMERIVAVARTTK
jgi:hypothetical protein